MRRDYMSVGAKYIQEGPARRKFEAAVDRLEWKEFKLGTKEAFMSAMGIREAIKYYRICGASHYAISDDMSPYGFFAILGHFTNGMAQVYILDQGDILIPLAVDFLEKEGTPKN